MPTTTPHSTASIQIVVPFPPGGIDLILQLFINGLKERLSQDVTFINRPGGTGSIGSFEVTKANPDGLTLLFASQGPLVYQPQINSVGYTVLHSFVPVCRVTSTPSVLMASGNSGITTIHDVVTASKAVPFSTLTPHPVPEAYRILAWLLSLN